MNFMSVDDILNMAKSRTSVRERFNEIAQHNQNPNTNPNCDDDKYLADLLKVLKASLYRNLP